MVEKIEHLRTPLQTIIDLEAKIRGSIAYVLSPGSVSLAFKHILKLSDTGGSTLRSSLSIFPAGEGSDWREATFPTIGTRDHQSSSHRPSVAPARKTKPTRITTRFDRRVRAREGQPWQDENDRLKAGETET